MTVMVACAKRRPSGILTWRMNLICVEVPSREVRFVWTSLSGCSKVCGQKLKISRLLTCK